MVAGTIQFEAFGDWVNPKPDATKRNLTGAINAKIEEAGLRIVAQKRVKWKLADAKKFYAVHAKRPFFKDLVKFMASGPIVVHRRVDCGGGL